jgi:probable HAF family extracellular repeat protein
MRIDPPWGRPGLTALRATSLALGLTACLRDAPLEPENKPPAAVGTAITTAVSGRMVDLGTLGGNSSFANDINDAARIVGWSQDGTDGAVHAFSWQNGVMTDLGALGGTESDAIGEGEDGRIVGRVTLPGSCANGGVKGFLWQSGSTTVLPRLPGGCRAEANAINASGWIAGFSYGDLDGDGNAPQLPVLWRNGTAHPLADDVPNVINGLSGTANDVNDKGQVVGQFGDHAFLWENGTRRDLGTLGGPFSEANAINEAGDIVGESHEPQHSLSSPVLWHDGRIQNLGSLGAKDAFGSAQDINEQGQVVGWSQTIAHERHAFVWENGVMTDLGGGTDAGATALNGKDQVVGFSARSDAIHAVLWTIPTADFWSIRKSLSFSRRGHAVVAALGRLYTIGGLGHEGPTPSVRSYNPASNVWSQRARLPAARNDGNGAATINGNVYLAGGFDASNVLTRTLYVYDPGSDTWSRKADMPLASGCGGSGAIGGRLYVYAGCTRTTSGPQVAARRLYRYDPGTNSWVELPQAPVVHSRPAVSAVGGKLYVAGGNDANGAALGWLDVYDPATNTWATRAPMPTARVAAAAASSGGKLYVAGGRNGTTYVNALEVYNPLTNAWAKKTGMPAPRAGLGMAAIDNLLYAVGGRYQKDLLEVNERYTP